MRQAYLAIQCATVDGITGDFLFVRAGKARKPVSPVFTNLASLFTWIRENGWRQLPYDPEHPVGVYECAEA